MTYRFLSTAEDELADALTYYDEQSTGLGADFLDEVEATIGRILAHPNAWRRISTNHRRCLMRRFPFGVVYSVEGDCVLVSAIMDLRRNPTSWRERLK